MRLSGFPCNRLFSTRIWALRHCDVGGADAERSESPSIFGLIDAFATFCVASIVPIGLLVLLQQQQQHKKDV